MGNNKCDLEEEQFAETEQPGDCFVNKSTKNNNPYIERLFAV